MAPDSERSILNALAASIRAAGGRGNIALLPSDSLKELGLGRLRLLAALIELEDIFAVEFAPDAIDQFRCAGDIALYIQSYGMMPADDLVDEPVANASQPLERRRAGSGRMRGLCARVFGRRIGHRIGLAA